MDRRDFIKKSIGAGIILTSGASVSTLIKNPLEAYAKKTSDNYDLVAIKGSGPDKMFDKAIEAFGGISKFVKKGQTVVVKPNIGWDVTPERAGCTHPKLVSRIIEQCYSAGAKKVYVFDHTCDNWKKCYSTSGIERAVKDSGGVIVTGANEGHYQKVKVKEGKILKNAKEHELILESDVFINVPILKHHSSAKLTIAMKNHMGIVWDRRYWHRNGLHQCIADYATYRKPDLNVVDAYYVMKRNGPRGVSKEDVIKMKTQLISTDMVAIDTAAAKLFGSDPDDIPYIKIAAEMGVGRKDLENLNIKRIVL